MKCKILLSISFLVSALIVVGQSKADKAFAIVSTSPGTMEWMNIQEIDLSTGNVIRSVFDKGNTAFVLLDAVTRKKIRKEPANDQSPELAPAEHPTSTMVAAAAFDKRHNKLFFTPMRLAQLRWIDIASGSNQLKVFCLTGQPFSFSDLNKEENHITRMAIASDGNGYALSNDGRIFTRFTTGKKPVVEQLGSLKDDPDNKDVSIHDRPNWGGDMIADATGNLFVVGANHAVFRINISSQTATHLGFIEGLPDDFTTNGAAIDNEGSLVLSSAQSTEGFYKADLSTLKAFKPDIQSQVLSSADLATGNLAFEKRPDEVSVMPDTRISFDVPGKGVNIYPNPVTSGYLKVDFKGYASGLYEINVADLSGKLIAQKKIIVNTARQTEGMAMNAKLAKGIYLVKIIDASGKMISSGKILLQ